MQIYLLMRIGVDIRIIRHMSDIARYAVHISDRHPIRIRMAIPNSDHAVGHHAVDQPPRALSLGGVHVHSMSWTSFQ